MARLRDKHTHKRKYEKPCVLCIYTYVGTKPVLIFLRICLLLFFGKNTTFHPRECARDWIAFLQDPEVETEAAVGALRFLATAVWTQMTDTQKAARAPGHMSVLGGSAVGAVVSRVLFERF